MFWCIIHISKSAYIQVGQNSVGFLSAVYLGLFLYIGTYGIWWLDGQKTEWMHFTWMPKQAQIENIIIHWRSHFIYRHFQPPLWSKIIGSSGGGTWLLVLWKARALTLTCFKGPFHICDCILLEGGIQRRLVVKSKGYGWIQILAFSLTSCVTW